jgi:hypothetical protein
LDTLFAPNGSSFYCETKEEIRIATTSIVGSISLIFKHLQFEAFNTKKIPNGNFSMDVAYCHITKVIGNALLIVILVILALLVLGFVCPAIYCVCFLVKQLRDCCSSHNDRIDYQSI